MTSRFDDSRKAEFVGGPWDGQAISPTDGGDLPRYLPMPWHGEVHGYWLIEPVGEEAFFEYRGRVLTHGSKVN